MREVDPVNGGGGTTLWLQDLTGDAEARPLFPNGGQGNTVRWAPDGGTLYFLSSRSGSNQIWATDTEGTQQVQVTDLPFDVDNRATWPISLVMQTPGRYSFASGQIALYVQDGKPLPPSTSCQDLANRLQPV